MRVFRILSLMVLLAAIAATVLWTQGRLPHQTVTTCIFDQPISCPVEAQCVYINGKTPRCVPRYTGHTPFLRFPVDPKTPVRCLQGPSTVREPFHESHASPATVNAVDLIASESEIPLFASLEGVALVYRDCGADADPSCGNGLGNHVRILNADGTMLLYAHMASVSIEDGQKVRIGEPIGKMGKTGHARRPMLHLSLHHAGPGDWVETLSTLRENPEKLPPSIPFELQYCDPANSAECVRKRSRMDQLPCGDGDQPSAEILRADWRN